MSEGFESNKLNSSISRRRALQAIGSLAVTAALQSRGRSTETTRPASLRDYHVCLTSEAMSADPELLKAVHDAGVANVWMPAFFYGHWPYSIEQVVAGRGKIEALGMSAHVLNCALGHPGNSLATTQSSFPLTPPENWKLGVGVDGATYTGTSLHPPANEENARAVRMLAEAGFDQLFLDDDFRLARDPGHIGGCFCDAHRMHFCQSHGYTAPQWEQLKDDVRSRRRSCLAGCVDRIHLR